MNEMKIISWEEVPETVQKRLLDRWYIELINRYEALGFGEPRPDEIERDKEYRFLHTVFLQSDHIFYECELKRI